MALRTLGNPVKASGAHANGRKKSFSIERKKRKNFALISEHNREHLLSLRLSSNDVFKEKRKEKKAREENFPDVIKNSCKTKHLTQFYIGMMKSVGKVGKEKRDCVGVRSRLEFIIWKSLWTIKYFKWFLLCQWSFENPFAILIPPLVLFLGVTKGNIIDVKNVSAIKSKLDPAGNDKTIAQEIKNTKKTRSFRNYLQLNNERGPRGAAWKRSLITAMNVTMIRCAAYSRVTRLCCGVNELWNKFELGYWSFFLNFLTFFKTFPTWKRWSSSWSTKTSTKERIFPRIFNLHKSC